MNKLYTNMDMEMTPREYRQVIQRGPHVRLNIDFNSLFKLVGPFRLNIDLGVVSGPPRTALGKDVISNSKANIFGHWNESESSF